MADFLKVEKDDIDAAYYARAVCDKEFISTTDQSNTLHGASVFLLIKQAYKDGKRGTEMKPEACRAVRRVLRLCKRFLDTNTLRSADLSSVTPAYVIQQINLALKQVPTTGMPAAQRSLRHVS